MYLHLVAFVVVAALALLATPVDALFRKVGNLPEARFSFAALAHRGAPFVVGNQPSVLTSANGGANFNAISDLYLRNQEGTRAVVFTLPGQGTPSVLVTDADLTINGQGWIMSSADGSSGWSRLPISFMRGRTHHGFVVARSPSSSAMQLYVFGGASVMWWNGRPVLYCPADVHSSNGNNMFSPVMQDSRLERWNFAFTTVADSSRVILSGGITPQGGYFADALISSIGLTSWTTLPAPKFSPRQGHSMVNNNGVLYMAGGYNGAQFFNDVWISTDTAQSWLQLTAAAEFSPRGELGLVIIGNDLLVIGGMRTRSEVNSDVWTMPL